MNNQWDKSSLNISCRSTGEQWIREMPKCLNMWTVRRMTGYWLQTAVHSGLRWNKLVNLFIGICDEIWLSLKFHEQGSESNIAQNKTKVLNIVMLINRSRMLNGLTGNVENSLLSISRMCKVIYENRSAIQAANGAKLSFRKCQQEITIVG